MLDVSNAVLLKDNAEYITEIRIRCQRPLQLSLLNGRQILGTRIMPEMMERIVSNLMDDSLYSRERELRQGYFTTREGCRVGVCGKTSGDENGIENFSDIGSLCIRVPREIKGCLDEVIATLADESLKSMLFISPPGMGKTTMLREMARVLSGRGYNVAIADERREIAACISGVPMMDVGIRSDIMDGCPKAISIPILIRACAPDVLIADEIGTSEDSAALLDASRCGVKVIASAHGLNFTQVSARRSIAPALQEGAFDYWALLGPTPGKIKYLRKCADGVLNHAERDFADDRDALLCGNRARIVQCT